jgi:hypothetical protein
MAQVPRLAEIERPNSPQASSEQAKQPLMWIKPALLKPLKIQNKLNSYMAKSSRQRQERPAKEDVQAKD